MRTRLALSAALPLVAVLAACSTGTGTGTGSPATPSSTTSTSTGSPNAGTTTTSIDDGSHRGTTVTGRPHSTPMPAVSHRPTVKDALDTVRSYVQREIGMNQPRTGAYRWTGTDTGEVVVRSAAGGERIPGPASTVSVRRLRTVWFVTGARTGGIRLDTSSLGGRVSSSSFQISGRILEPGMWRVTVTQDRYGKDLMLGSGPLITIQSGRPDVFRQGLQFAAPTTGTGSVIISEGFAGVGLGVMRATVIRVHFAPPPAGPSCAPSALLPVLKAWFDNTAVENVIADVKVLRCRNGFARVLAVQRVNPPGHNQFDSPQVFMHYRQGHWHRLDVGTGLSCDEEPLDTAIQQACRELGYTR